MTKLSSTQTQLLTAAAASDTGAVTIPDDAKPAAAGLIKRGFAISVAQAEGPNQLVITKAGLDAIGAPLAGDANSGGPRDSQRPSPNPAVKPEATGKVGAVIALLRQPEGATIEAMMQATGWQAHSVRGAIAGSVKKKHGLTVMSEKTESGRIYRIPAEALA